MNTRNYSQYLTKQLQTYIPYNVNDKILTIDQSKIDGVDYCFLNSTVVAHIVEEDVVDVQKKIMNTLKNKIKEFDITIHKQFINFKLKDSILKTELVKYFNADYLIDKTKHPLNILVDFSSPNIAKNLHVGHLRSTIIGDTIAHVFEKIGHNVKRINHIGDFGTQFGMLIQHLYDSIPDFTETKKIDIKNLQQFYQQAKKRFDKEEKFKKEAYKKTIRLQNNDPEIVYAWNLICDISRISFNDIYDRLNVKLEECGESFYRTMLPDTVIELEKNNLITDTDGAKMVFSNIKKKKKHPLVVVKSNGGFTYDTTDLAAIKYRLIDLKMDHVYYVVDNGQKPHFDLIFDTAKRIGWLTDKHTVKHIGFGVVLGEDGKRIKSRDGDTIPLTDLLDTSLDRAKTTIEDRNTEHMTEIEIQNAINSIAYGAIKYADLSTKRLSNYKFSYDKMLSLKGNTVVYQMYSHVRMHGIKNNLEKSGLFNVSDLITLKVEFEYDNERTLALKLLQYNEAINKVAKSQMPHFLCDYLYDLATLLQYFSNHCQCISFDKEKKPKHVNLTRAMLCLLAIRVQKDVFELLGIKTIGKI
jgi:arginyl-tRNA synthetase